MSHKSSELELTKGVNVLTGPNNSGKSAIVSALQLLTELPPKEGAYMVRHGQNDTEVTVETSEGDVIIWGRKGQSLYLTINGKKHTRLTNDREYFLKELHQVLRLPSVKNKEEVFDIHFACQKQPIFLLNEPPTRAATFFSTSSDAGRLVEVRELFKNKVVKAKDRQRTLAKKQLFLEQKIEKLAPLQDLEKDIHKLKNEFDELAKQGNTLSDGFTLLTTLKNCSQEYANLNRKHELLAQANSPPEVKNVVTIDASISQTRLLAIQQKELKKYLAVFTNLRTQPSQEDVSALSQTLQNIKNQNTEQSNLSEKHNALENLEQKPLVADCLQLQDLIAYLSNLSQTINQKFSINLALQGLSSPPEGKDVSRLDTTIKVLRETQTCLDLYHEQWKVILRLSEPPRTESSTSLEEYLKNHKSYQLQVRSFSDKLFQASSAFQKWISEHPSCPTCGAPLSSEHSSGALHHE